MVGNKTNDARCEPRIGGPRINKVQKLKLLRSALAENGKCEIVIRGRFGIAKMPSKV